MRYPTFVYPQTLNVFAMSVPDHTMLVRAFGCGMKHALVSGAVLLAVFGGGAIVTPQEHQALYQYNDRSRKWELARIEARD